MLADEIREILRDLGDEIGAQEIEVAASETPLESDAERIVHALGNGRYLVVSRGQRGASGPTEELERAIRALRAATRRWEEDAVPTLVWRAAEPPSHDRITARIADYLEAMAGTSQARNALVTLYGDVVASANEPLLLESERVPFTIKRVDADAEAREGTSFGEVMGDDYYARSFWVGAHLILFFEGPWALDFVRHRARHVCRELGHLLAALEPPPNAPASVAPIPE